EKLGGLRQVLRENPDQLRRADELGRWITRWDEIMKKAVEIRTAQGIQAAAELLKGDEVKKLGERVKVLVKELDDQENNVLNQRHLRAKQSAERAMLLIGGGVILA